MGPFYYFGNGFVIYYFIYKGRGIYATVAAKCIAFFGK
jgi:hypothetical protein